MLEVNQLIDFMQHSAILKLRFGIALFVEKLARVLNPDLHNINPKTSYLLQSPESNRKGWTRWKSTCAPTNHSNCFTLRLLREYNQQCIWHHRLKRMDLLGGRSPLWVMGHESWVMICHGSWLFFVYLFFEFLDYGCKYLEDTSHIVIQRVEGFICEITIGMK